MSPNILPLKILDKLKKIVDIKNILNNFSGKIVFLDFSRKVENHKIQDNRTLIINSERLSKEQLSQIKKELIDSEIKKGRAILEKGIKEETSEILDNLPIGEDEKMIEFYSDKLSPEFIDALEAALVVRSMNAKGRDIRKKKTEIAKKYPLFGRNLCNMVSADYFNKDFKVLYSDMKEEGNFDPHEYKKTVERIVRSKPYTEFIHKHKTLEEWSGLLNYKIERLRKYGLHELEIYAFSYENVKLTDEILEDFKDNENVDSEIIIKTKTYIFVKLLF